MCEEDRTKPTVDWYLQDFELNSQLTGTSSQSSGGHTAEFYSQSWRPCKLGHTAKFYSIVLAAIQMSATQCPGGTSQLWVQLKVLKVPVHCGFSSVLLTQWQWLCVRLNGGRYPCLSVRRSGPKRYSAVCHNRKPLAKANLFPLQGSRFCIFAILSSL